MYKSWKQGIPCHVFRKELVKDISLMVEMDEAINNTVDRERRINNMLSSLKGGM